MILTDLEQGSAEWQEWRKSRVCASEIAAIMDCCPYQTGFELWMRKTGRLHPIAKHRGMELGHEAEVQVREWLNGHTQHHYRPACAECDSEPRFAASLDAWCEEGIAEIKLVSADCAKDFERGGKISRHHWLQMQWQMYVTGFKSCLYVYRNGEINSVRNVVADEAIQAVMAREALKFLDCLDRDTPWDKTDRDMHRLNVEEQLEIDYLNALEILEEQKQVVDALKHQLLSHMKYSHERGRFLKIKTVERAGSVDYKRMLNELAERYQIDDQDMDPELWRKPSSHYVRITNAGLSDGF